MNTNNSIFTRVLALVLCLIMATGILTACFQEPETDNVIENNDVTKNDIITVIKPGTATLPDAEKDPNEIFSASTTIDSSNLVLGTLTNDVVIGGNDGVTALVPADVKVETNASSLALSLKNVEENDIDLGDVELLIPEDGVVTVPIDETLAGYLTEYIDWGYCLIVQGQGCILKKITIF